MAYLISAALGFLIGAFVAYAIIFAYKFKGSRLVGKYKGILDLMVCIVAVMAGFLMVQVLKDDDGAYLGLAFFLFTIVTLFGLLVFYKNQYANDNKKSDLTKKADLTTLGVVAVIMVFLMVVLDKTGDVFAALSLLISCCSVLFWLLFFYRKSS